MPVALVPVFVDRGCRAGGRRAGAFALRLSASVMAISHQPLTVIARHRMHLRERPCLRLCLVGIFARVSYRLSIVVVGCCPPALAPISSVCIGLCDGRGLSTILMPVGPAPVFVDEGCQAGGRRAGAFVLSASASVMAIGR